MPLARFLQLSDVHLGRPFGWLPVARREERRRDQRMALERAVVEARERQVHAILVPGDLFDQEATDPNTLNFALDVFDHPNCPPVFISPGNHDPFSTTSHYYNPRQLKGRGLSWPKHVHIFGAPEWTSVTLEGAPTVRIWGRGFAAGGRADQRPLSKEALATVREAVNASNKEGSPKVEVAVLHASREGFCPPGQKVTAPFSDAEIYDSPFAYVALGHYHARSELPGDGKRSSGVRAAYAGSTVSLDLVELAAHGVLAVSVEHGSGTPQVKLEFSELDKRRAHDIPVDITGCPHTDAIERRIFRGLEESRVRYEDLVTVRLAGRLPQGIRYEPSHELEQRVFYVKVDRRRLRPDHDLASYRGDGPGRTTEERFARAMLGKLDKEKDGERRALIESALYYGLDALKRQGIVPCYEDLGE